MAGGVVQHLQEWWHWEYGTRYWSAVTGEPVLLACAPGVNRSPGHLVIERPRHVIAAGDARARIVRTATAAQ